MDEIPILGLRGPDSALSDFFRLCEKGCCEGSASAGSSIRPGRDSAYTGARSPNSSRPAQVASSTPSRLPDAATRARIQDLLNRIQDAYFDYDKHTLRPDAEAALKTDAQTLADIIKQYPDFKLTVEGHCDERGSDEYNLALGDARAKQTREYLSTLGLPAQSARDYQLRQGQAGLLRAR